MFQGGYSSPFPRRRELPSLIVDTNYGLYKVGECVGAHRSGSKVYGAVYCPEGTTFTEGKEVVGLLAVNGKHKDFIDVFRQVKKNINCNHVNVLEVKDHFYYSDHLWISFPLKEVQSMRYMMYHNPGFRNGLPEFCIAVVLLQTIYGLSSVHEQGEVHGQITAGQVFWDSSVRKIKIAYGASMFDRLGELEMIGDSDFPIWAVDQWAAPPECFKNPAVRTTKSDSWLIGIIALELAYGRLQMHDREEFLGFVRSLRSSKTLPNRNRGVTWALSPETTEPDDIMSKIWKKLRHVKRVVLKYMNPRYLLARFVSRRYKLVNHEDEGGIEVKDKKKKGLRLVKFLKDTILKVPVPRFLKSNKFSFCKLRKKVKIANYPFSAFSESFSIMVADCLDDDPVMRPGLWELSQYKFFHEFKATANFDDVMFTHDEELGMQISTEGLRGLSLAGVQADN